MVDCFRKIDAYTNREIVYTWRKGLEASVDVPPESSSLLQYDLVGQNLFSETYKINTGKGWHHHINPLRDAQAIISSQLCCFCLGCEVAYLSDKITITNACLCWPLFLMHIFFCLFISLSEMEDA